MSRRVLLILVSLIVAVPLVVLPAAAQPAGDVEILVLSNRADMISGGDALVEVVVPDGLDPAGLTVTRNGEDVTTAVRLRGSGRVIGLVEGLQEGGNEVTAVLPDGRGATIQITNHSADGPVFSGPQIQPWLCSTSDNGLGEATDDACNAPTSFTYTYENSDGEMADYDPDNPPDDVAMTTTDQGNEVPHIIRFEKGTMNRAIYEFAVLYDPSKPWEPWDPQPGFNGKLVWVMGASSGTHHVQSSPQSVEDGRALPLGFGVGSTSLNVNGNNSNQVVGAETMMMVQEHIRETYGETRYTIGRGCSGGSIQQNRIANSYPGLLDGLLPNCSYPDTWTVRQEVYDCLLINDFATSPEGAFLATPGALGAVTGYETGSSCAAWEGLFGANGDPRTGCQLPPEQQYDPESNPGGVRCTSNDYEINLWGRRPESVWGPVEQQLGQGFALNLTNNGGLQYGLEALQEGLVTPEQFVRLNAGIGALDIDYNAVDERTTADPGAVAIASRTGLVNDFSQVDRVAVIDLRGSSNNEIHTDFHSYEMRMRMDAANGHHDNQVIWTFPTSIFTPPVIDDLAFFTMDEWLSAIEADDSDLPIEQKVVANRPDGLSDQCWFDAGQTPPTRGEACDQRYPFYGTPRTAAGMPLTHDVTSCVQVALPNEPPTDGSYGQLPFVADQWARLQAAFPDGVCDFSVRHPDEVENVPWLTYADGPGGTAAGDAPVSVPFNGDGVTRLAGDNRIQTAVAISHFSNAEADTVVIARADQYADALAGSPLAAHLDAPLLLSDPMGLPQSVREEITRLDPSQAILLGGEEALSAQVAQELSDLGVTVDRVAGADRFATAATIADRLPPSAAAVLVEGIDADPARGWPDAVSVASLAAFTGTPILLTDTDNVPTATTAALAGRGVTEALVVGGTAAVSDSVFDAVARAGHGPRRIAGANRYATSALVLQEMVTAGMSPTTAWVATGRSFPDALSAGPAVAAAGQVLVLVDGGDPAGSPETLAALDSVSTSAYVVLGGVAAVSDEAVAGLARG